MKASGSMLSAAGGEAGLVVFDIADPTNPVEIARHPVAHVALDLALRPGLALVAEGEDASGPGRGLLVFDVSNPSTPALVSSIETGVSGATAVAAFGSFAYVSGDGPLYVIDISNPSKPAQVGSFWAVGSSLSVSPTGRRLYGLLGAALLVLDVSDPTAPWLVTAIQAVDDPFQGLALDATLLATVDPAIGLRVFQVASESGPPKPIGSLSSLRDTRHLRLQGSLLLSAEGPRGLDVVDVSEPAAPVEVGRFSTPDESFGIAVADSLAILRTGSALRILDVADPSNPVDLSSFQTDNHDDWLYGWSPRSFEVDAGVAFVPDSTGLRVVDVSDPGSPSEIGSWASPWPARSVTSSGDLLYLGIVSDPFLQNPSLYVLDVSDPSQPVAVNVLNGDGWWPSSLVASGDLLVGALPWECRTFDISTPASPVQVGSCDSDPQHLDLALRPGLLFVSGADRFSILDVSDPSAPALLGYVSNLWPPLTGIALTDHRAIVTHQDIGLRLIDIGRTSEPVEIGEIETPGLASQVAFANGRIYVADGAAGLSIYADCLVFDDGFESGDLSRWSSSTP